MYWNKKNLDLVGNRTKTPRSSSLQPSHNTVWALHHEDCEVIHGVSVQPACFKTLYEVLGYNRYMESDLVYVDWSVISQLWIEWNVEKNGRCQYYGKLHAFTQWLADINNRARAVKTDDSSHPSKCNGCFRRRRLVGEPRGRWEDAVWRDDVYLLDRQTGKAAARNW